MKYFGIAAGWLAMFCFLPGALSANSSYKTLDFPGSPGGLLLQINSAGQIVGSYTDDDGRIKDGFISTGRGQFTTVHVPSSSWTNATSISNSGMVTGYSDSPDGLFFIRSAAGDYSTFSIPGGYTLLWDNPMIDDAGDVAGTYEDITQKTRGYFHSANGTFSNIDVPGASATYLRGINAEGEIAGDFFNDSGSYGFTITPDGSLIEFDIPKSSGPIRVGAIGADGAVAGTYTDQGGTQYCFLRNKKGRIKSFPLQQGTTFSPQSIGPNDQIIGYENNGSAVIKSDGTSTFYFDPRGSHTYLKSMNANRLVGYYTDKHYYALTHGFIVDKVPAR